MKKQRIKYLLTVICMLAAGICYSCSGRTNQVDLDGQVLVMDLQKEQASQEAGVQSGLISAKTEAGEESPENPEEMPGKEPLPWQTESVRFYVHICGEVENPGVYEMEPGSRIFQAVELAGGFTQEAAEDYLNMAQETADGMKITVPSKAEIRSDKDNGRDGDSNSGPTENERASGAEQGTASENAWIQMPDVAGSEPSDYGSSPQKVNLNTATKEELMTLKGIGEAKAADIIRYRQEHGPFQTIEEVMNISGIKEAAFRKIKDDITV